MEQEKVQAPREHQPPSRLIQGLLAVAVIIMVTCFGIYYRFTNSTTFASGVEIGGVSVEGLNQEQAMAAVGQRLEDFFGTPVVFYKDDYTHEATLGELSQQITGAEAVNQVWEQENSRSWQAKAANLVGGNIVDYPIDITMDTDKKAKQVSEWNERWGKAAVNADLEVDSQNGLVVLPGSPGYRVDVEQTFAGLPKTVSKAEPLRLPIIMEPIQPEVTPDMLKNMGELSSFFTYFNTGEINRSHNLRKAAASINKKVLQPNAVFSFNETVGQRTMEKGYLDAMVIVGNKFEPGLGGGICQVSSTLYNACLLAGLEIVERHNHNLAVAYVQVGRDATVNWGLQDLKFRNNTDRPIYIRSVTSGGQLLINIYGDTQYKKRIEISSIVDKTLDFTTVTEVDNTLAPGQQVVNNKGQLGYVVRSFRTFYGQDGKIIKSEQLDTDTYKPLNRLILKGPDLVPTMPEQPVEGDDEQSRPAQPRKPTPNNPRGAVDSDEDDQTALNYPTIQP
ncbi:MAG: VanW family protein [Syntrophomonadaceae bacterium]